MNREQTFFLSVLADHLNERTTSPIAGLDWKSVYDMATKHQVSAIFYAQCGAFLPPEAELQFLQDYGSAVADYAVRRKIAAEIDREFTLQKIPYVLVKGLSVAESYPQPELRTMGDIDIVVKAEDKEKAHWVLLKLGFKNESKGINEWVYWKRKYEIELHHRLLYSENLNVPASLHLANQMWEFVQVVPESSRCELSPEFHFLFLIMHLSKHVVFSGAGFRQFMDLAVTAQKWQLDWRKLERWLTEVDLFLFARICLTLCQTWLQLPLPLAGAELSPEFAEETVQQLFRNGVFGKDNRANADNHLIARLNGKNGDSLHSRWLLCWKQLFSLSSPELKKMPVWQFYRILFPDYDYLRKQNNCRFIDGRPWLLPAGWGWRFILSGKFRIRRSIQIIFLCRKKIRERQKKLKEMGLFVHPENRGNISPRLTSKRR